MQKTIKKLIAVFTIIILAALLTGCLSTELNNKIASSDTNESAATIKTDNKTETSVSENPGNSDSSSNSENKDSSSTDLSDTTVETETEGTSSDTTKTEEDITADSTSESESVQDSVNTIPVLTLAIVEGPVILEDNSLCYYRVKAETKGSPAPKLFFSKDDSNGAWGSSIVQVNLSPGESYELIVKASNSSGQANASTILNWQAGAIQTGQTNIVSEEANPGNYFIEVSLSEQKVRVFYKNALLREMICSTGAPSTPTPIGTFKTSDKIKYAWLPKFNVGAYYFVRFYGSYLFHSTPFDKEGNMIEEEKQKLGTPVSHGCIRLDLNEEKWLYETVPSGVTVKIN